MASAYQLIDTGASCGNEEAVGRVVRSTGIPREEWFVTTKLWIQHPREANAKAAFGGSLKRLGLDHLDLYLIHQPLGDCKAAFALSGASAVSSQRSGPNPGMVPNRADRRSRL